MTAKTALEPAREHVRHPLRPLNLIAALLLAAWPIALLGSPVNMFLILALILVPLLLAVDSGSPAMVQWATLLFLAVMGIVAANEEAGLTAFALLGATTIMAGALLGLGAGLRRSGRIDPETQWRVIGAHAAVSLVALVAVVAVDGTPDRELEWPIVPAAVGLLMVAGVGLWWSGRRHASPDDTTRWLPGARRQATFIDDGLGGPAPPTAP